MNRSTFLPGLRPAALLCMLALLSGCATITPGGIPVDARHRAAAQDSRAMFLVLHYTYADLPLSLKVLTQDAVSAHYLVSDGSPARIYRLVDEERRAWHAGASAWKGTTMLNAASIGIELVNPGLRPGPDGPAFAPYGEAQIAALIPLLQDIVRRHGIRPDRVLGHSDIAPQRKVDPGPLFPWKRLADLGLVLWPDPARVAQQRAVFEALPPSVGWFQAALAQHGFTTPQTGVLDEATRKVLAAFQMKYRPARYDGEPDAETAALLDVLLTTPLPEPGAAARADDPR